MSFSKRPMAGVVAMYASAALFAAGASFIAPQSEAAVLPTASTTDHHYATRPVFAGTVTSVSERELVMDTEQGEQVVLAVDSRTVVPAPIRAGMAVRTEFAQTANGHYYAQRIVPLRSGMNPNRELAYSRPGMSGEPTVQFASTDASGNVTYRTPQIAFPASYRSSTSATPGTYAYRLATEPGVTGEVVAVNDHDVVVVSEQGEAVKMEMDSHTMLPPDLAPGMVVRAEFKATDDDAYYAKRIVPIRGAVVTNHDMAVLETAPLEQGTPITEVYREEAVVSRPVVVEPAPVSEPVAEEASDAAIVASDISSEESLPQTASQQPLMGLLALLSLGAAGAVSFVRRRGSI